MNFEKIKEIWEERKTLIIIGVVVILGGFWYFNQKSTSIDNSDVLSSQVNEKSKSSSQKTSSSSLENKQSSVNQKVTCDISGAVKHGGVYTLKNGSRLMDLIEAAGGLHERAEIKAINRAQLLKDQDQIYVPYKGEKVDLPVNSSTSTGNESTQSSSTSSSGDQVHLNSASVADLQKLNGIGQKKAEQIIQYRDQNGGFKQIEDLTKVSGIGEKTFEKLKDQLAL